MNECPAKMRLVARIIRVAVVVIALVAMIDADVAGQSASDPRVDLDRTADLVSRPLADRASRWRCDPVRTTHCTSEGCKDIPTTVWLIIDFRARTYARCDARGCDQHPLGAVRSGMFTVATPSVGTFLKTLNDGTEFVDVASAGTAVFANFGMCKADPGKR